MAKPEYEAFQNLRLPVHRSNRGLQDNQAYLTSIRQQIAHISDYLGADVSVLDFGCGQGRLLNGLVHSGTDFGSYLGVDLNPASIAWCCRNLSYAGLNTAFLWYNYHNQRYNAAGDRKTFLPLPKGCFDLAFASSVFTHLDDTDLGHVAMELFCKIRPGGHLYLTAFLEEAVDPVTINPEGYLGSKGAVDTPLHWVRYEKTYFLNRFAQAGFVKVPGEDGAGNLIERSGQRWVVFQKPH